ncbi:MAG TPA: YcnI family protein [Pseudolysinimonas sp.]|nr:YcnI family protein [Pseudolysinimonas sp.]
MNNPTRRVGVTALALGAAALLAIAAPLSASAHVSLEQNTATPGSFTTLTFRVPNEAADGASTNKLTVTLPTGKSLLESVSYIPVPGWTTELVTTKLDRPIVEGDSTITEAVTRVVWTAKPGSEYGPASEGQFSLFVGAIPDVGRLSLPTEQGYTDGSVISWSGADGSEHPAPVLYVNDAPPTSDDPDSAPQTTVTAPAPTSTTAQPDVLARALGAVGLVLGAIALVIAIVGRRPARKAG